MSRGNNTPQAGRGILALEEKTLGRYKILGELGRGAMGAVYRAIDPMIEREVAIKTLLPNLPPEVLAEVRERFIREARSAGRLNHPSIVTIFDVGEQDGMAYIAMELLEGRSLQDTLKAGERPAFDYTAELIAQIADALDLAQSYKIVHRDVKPANIMIGTGGRAKLTDFGVARIDSSSMTQTGTALGSPKYMSPEQVLGLPVDPRSDIFSLGVVLYEMLTGRTPFERDSDTTVFSLMNRIAGEPHIPARELNPKIPVAFDVVLNRALAKKAEERYQRAGEMAAALRAYRSADPKQASAEYEKTMVLGRAAPGTAPRPAAKPAPPKDEKLSTELITDFEKFAKDFEQEEQARIRAEEELRARKEEELRRWGAEEERRREEFDRTRSIVTSAGAGTDPGTTGSIARGALEFLKKQAASQAPKENPAIAREKAITALDTALRAAYRYLAEVVNELNSVTPASAGPYTYIYMGKLPPVTLSDAFVDSRPLRIPGKDVVERVMMRYRITLSAPVKFTLMGDDIGRCMAFVKALRVDSKVQSEAKNDFGKVTKASFEVKGVLPCEILLRGDYDNPSVVIELLNVRRPGKWESRIAPDKLEALTDDLARYVLGVDDDLEKQLRRAL